MSKCTGTRGNALFIEDHQGGGWLGQVAKEGGEGSLDLLLGDGAVEGIC